MEGTAAHEERVTPLELFFDLVFVFAITQVTSLLSDDPTWGGVLRGMLVLGALWWAWAAYAWLTNTLNPEEGAVRLAVFAAMGAMLVVALAVPEAFDDHGVLFGVAYLVVRAMHIALYAIAAKGDHDLLGAVLRMTPSSMISGVLLVTAGFLEGDVRIAVWVIALAIDYLGVLVGRGTGWRVSPHHFAERHGLIVIIAIGESIVAVGVGAAGLPLDAGRVTAALLGVAVAAGLWWTYFDWVSIVTERMLGRVTGAARAALARDVYSYLHLPMVAGIVLFALAMKKTLANFGDPLDDDPGCGSLRRARASICSRTCCSATEPHWSSADEASDTGGLRPWSRCSLSSRLRSSSRRSPRSRPSRPWSSASSPTRRSATGSHGRRSAREQIQPSS